MKKHSFNVSLVNTLEAKRVAARREPVIGAVKMRMVYVCVRKIKVNVKSERE
jgi:hypothetical protein